MLNLRTLIGIPLALAAGSFAKLQSAEPANVVLLLHPKAARPAQVAGQETELSSVLNLPTKEMPRPLPAKARVEIGQSHKDVKDWTLLLQYGAPRFGSNPGKRVDVPFTVYSRPSADEPAIKVGFGTLHSGGGVFARPEDAMDRVNFGHVPHLLMTSEAARVFEDKLVVVQEGANAVHLAPVSVDLEAQPPTATVRLKNKLGVPVGLALVFQNKKSPAATDTIYSTRLRDDLDRLDPIILLAGEAKPVTIALKDLKKGQEPKWCKMTNLYLMADTRPKP